MGETAIHSAAENFDRFAATCSVVVCTRDRPTHVDRCLEAVSRLVYPRFNVLIVDNAPSDARTRGVARHWGVDYIVEPVVGLSRARNRGALACDTEIVAYLDDDAIPRLDWLSALVLEFKDQRAMAVTGRVLPLSVETEAERLCALTGCLNSGGLGRRAIDRQTPTWFELANFGGIGDGGNMAFRRSAFDIWPGFDERLGRGVPLHGGEEHYAFFSLIDRGYRVVHTPRAVVRHPCPQTMEALRARYLKDLAAATGYFTFLLMEEPRHRRATLKYIAEGLRGTPRTWRGEVVGRRPRIVPRWRMLLAWLSGPWLYARSSVRRPPSARRPSELVAAGGPSRTSDTCLMPTAASAGCTRTPPSAPGPSSRD